MTLHKQIFRVRKFGVDNAPTILTAVGVVGIIGTGYLSAQAGFRACEILAFEERMARMGSTDGSYVWDNKTKVQLVYKEFLPAIGLGALSVAAVIGSNRIGTSRTAALASAYAISDRAYREYKDKVVEKIGEKKAQTIHDEVVQDRVMNTSGSNKIVLKDPNDVPCFDCWSGRYFPSNMETLKKAMNDLNYKIINHQYASLNDFYDLIGLTRTKPGEELGWNADKLLEIVFTTTMTDDDKPCIAIDFDTQPMRNYFRFH